MDEPEDITELLHRFQAGDEDARSQLIDAVHGELRVIAARYMRREKGDHTLQTTALVNEAYLKLVNLKTANWQDRAHFYAVASRVMRRILVDHARKHIAGKRGGGIEVLPLNEAIVFTPGRSSQIVRLDEALTRLAETDDRASKVIELRFFGGLSVEAGAEEKESSPRPVKQEWMFARAWLRSEFGLGQEENAAPA